jgi:hypothetical protein
MKPTWVGIVVCVVTAAAGCSPKTTDEGSAEISVQGLSLTNVMALDVSVSGVDILTPLERPLFLQSDDTWKALLGRIPVGTGRTFTAKAYDNADKTHQIYSGSVTNVTISSTSIANVIVVLQEDTANPGFTNQAPIVDGLTVSATSVSYGDKVAIRLTAHDADQGETAGLAFTSSMTCGTFETPLITTDDSGNRVWANLWTAPPADGVCQLSFEIADVRGAKAMAAVTIHVSAGQNTGAARVSTLVQSYPIITTMTSTPVAPAADLLAGGSTTLMVVATQPDQEPMTFAWSTDCDGAFSDASTSSSMFTLAAGSAASTCTFTAVVSCQSKTGSDGQAKKLSTKGSLTVNVGSTSAGPAVGGPVIDLTSQSAVSVEGGGTVSFYVRARENNSNAALSVYSWLASDGSLASPVNPPDLSFSQVNWTAPAAMAGPASVTVTITDSQGATAGFTFVIQSANPPYPILDNITSTPMPPPTTLEAGGSTTLNVVAHEPTGGAMTFVWSTDCVGVFDSTLAQSPLFTLAADSTASTCTFTVVISGPPRTDNNGHSQILTTTGSLTVNVGVTPPQPPVGGPVIGITSQSTDVALPGDIVTLYVPAQETNSAATLSNYSWSALHGSLGVPQNAPDLSYSQVEWTAPTGMAATELITVVVTDSQGATASYSFFVNLATP